MHLTEPSETETAAAHSSGQELRKQFFAAHTVSFMASGGMRLRFPCGLPRTDNGNWLRSQPAQGWASFHRSFLA